MAAQQQRILAMGGVQLTPGTPDWPLLQYMLDLTGRERPRICLLATAGGDQPSGHASFYSTFVASSEPTHLNLFDRRIDDIEAFLLEQDAVLVAGGNTANMLAIWRIHGVDRALRAAWEAGVVLAGWSAGANCWFEASLTDSFGPNLAALQDGTRLLPGSFCPHYDSESLRRPRYEELVGAGTLPDGYAADDSVGILFEGRQVAAVVAALPGQHAYRVERRRGNTVEDTQVRAKLLR